ncbi:alpha/beta fold hydrolase [Sphingobacterium siyangense]|uniref:alpha/beta fold hydrolase n=1 Tax=Sphingobacterium siyangense TaxID=459529 RepID=UPI0019668B82|nr:alpha/beta hydrolase [Sphingobacterium siyangense]QRY60303.1 alpha/beta hydrolase [Sphingobacterium siyangense]
MKTWTIMLFFVSIGVIQTYAQETANIKGIRTSYWVKGLEKRKANEPIVIFESGIGMSGNNFSVLFPKLMSNIPYFSYDRNGLGNSDPDPSLKSDQDVVDKLHLILSSLEIKPPYLLVGHSLGGAFVRLFAAKYPDEIAGLVLIDPTDFMLTKTEDAIATKTSNSQIGYQQLWVKMLSDMISDKNLGEGVKLEMKRELAVSEKHFFKEYANLPLLKNVPVTVFIAYNRPIERYEKEMNSKLGINDRFWFDAYDQLRIKHYANLIKQNNNCELILLPGYSHGIHQQDPDKVGVSINSLFKKITH